MERTFHITLRADGMWEAKAAGKETAVLVADTREAIVEDIYELGKALGDTLVVVHAADGQLLEERTFPASR